MMWTASSMDSEFDGSVFVQAAQLPGASYDARSSLDTSAGSTSDSDQSREEETTHCFTQMKLRALRRRDRLCRKFWDSAEWQLGHLLEDAAAMMQQELAAQEEELPVAWKVLPTQIPHAPAALNLRYSTSVTTAAPPSPPDAAMTTDQTTGTRACGSCQPPAAWRRPAGHASVPTGGQPLAFQHKPSRLGAAPARRQ